MYNLISLPRNTLKMTEKLICGSLEKTQQTGGFKKCQGRTAKKRGHRAVPFGIKDRAGWGCKQQWEAWGTTAGAESPCSVEGPGVPDRKLPWPSPEVLYPPQEGHC